jgi:hypothetical protein
LEEGLGFFLMVCLQSGFPTDLFRSSGPRRVWLSKRRKQTFSMDSTKTFGENCPRNQLPEITLK